MNPDEQTVVAFNEAINGRDLAALAALMADGHRFTDPAGAVVDGKPACTEAWRGFFERFPDYQNHFYTVQSADGGVVEVTGWSECSEPALAGPARWRAVVRDGLVTEWQVSAR